MTGDAFPIVFFFPWREASGGPVFLSSIAKAVAEDRNAKVYYVDYNPGLSDALLFDSNVEKITVTDEDMSIGIDEPIFLVTPIYWADRLPQLHPKSKVLFVNWHNLCIPVLQSTWTQLDVNGMLSFLELVRDTNSVAFCDAAHRAAQNAFGVEFPENYIPIGWSGIRHFQRDYCGEPRKIRFGILGRLVIDKVFSVINLARIYDAIEFEGEKELHVIGDGPESNRIRMEDYPSVKIIMTGSLFGDALESYICRNIDVMFGMGTSVLVSASMGIPSVVVCNEMHDYYDDVFAYLQDSVGWSLGWQIHQIPELGVASRTLASIVRDVDNPTKRRDLGTAARDYLTSHHSMVSMIESFKTALYRTSLDMSQFRDWERRTISSSSSAGIVGKVRHYSFGRLGRLKTYRLLDKSRVIENGDGRVLARIKPRGLQRAFWLVGLLSLAFILLPLIVLAVARSSIRRTIRRRAARHEETLSILLELQRRLTEIEARSAEAGRALSRLDADVKQISVQNSDMGEALRGARETASHFAEKLAQITDEKSEIALERSLLPSRKLARMYPGTDVIPEASFTAFVGEVSDLYLSLVDGLDDESRYIVTRTLRRLREFAVTGSDVFQLTSSEEVEYNMLMDFHFNRILPVEDGWFLYDGKWKLPSPEISSTVFFYRNFVPELTHPERFRKKDILDVGAFMGDSAVILSDYTDSNVFSFEPSPRNFELLKRTCAVNGLAKVKPQQVGLSNQEGVLSLSENGDMSSFRLDGDLPGVSVTTIDAFVTKHELEPGLIKIDVEGHEALVLEGAVDTIRRFRPALLVSIYHNYEQFFGIRRWIESLGLGYRFKVRKPLDRGVSTDLVLICEVSM